MKFSSAKNEAPKESGCSIPIDARQVMPMRFATRLTIGLLLVQAGIVLTVVLERFLVALYKLYKFYFAWPQPIYFQSNTVIFFVAYSVMIWIASHWLARSAEAGGIKRFAKLAKGMNASALVVVLMMLLSKLAMLS